MDLFHGNTYLLYIYNLINMIILYIYDYIYVYIYICIIIIFVYNVFSFMMNRTIWNGMECIHHRASLYIYIYIYIWIFIMGTIGMDLFHGYSIFNESYIK